MSENYCYYAAKMAEKRDRSRLRPQLAELFEVVRRCEAMWTLEERIEGLR